MQTAAIFANANKLDSENLQDFFIQFMEGKLLNIFQTFLTCKSYKECRLVYCIFRIFHFYMQFYVFVPGMCDTSFCKSAVCRFFYIWTEETAEKQLRTVCFCFCSSVFISLKSCNLQYEDVRHEKSQQNDCYFWCSMQKLILPRNDVFIIGFFSWYFVLLPVVRRFRSVFFLIILYI